MIFSCFYKKYFFLLFLGTEHNFLILIFTPISFSRLSSRYKLKSETWKEHLHVNAIKSNFWTFLQLSFHFSLCYECLFYHTSRSNSFSVNNIWNGKCLGWGRKFCKGWCFLKIIFMVNEFSFDIFFQNN